jgi:hypothetical protein
MELLDDLKLISQLDEDGYNQIIEAMSKECSDLEWGILVKNLSKQKNSESIKAVIRFVNFIAENKSNQVGFDNKEEDIDKYLNALLKDEPEASKGWERIKDSLIKLNTYFLKNKEVSIKDRYSRITYFKIVSDIRPIFSMDKNKVIKNIYPHILKIETVDGKEFLCEFYEDTIDELIQELNIAKQKQDVLKKIYG